MPGTAFSVSGETQKMQRKSESDYGKTKGLVK